jgi:sugar phosphate isomerase/epimerase
MGYRDKGEVEAVGQQLRDLNLRCTAGIGSLQLHAKGGLVREALSRAMAGLEFAAALGAHTATFGPSLYGRVSRYGHVRMAIEQYAQLADTAARYGLRICHENYDNFTADEFQQIFDACGRDNLGLTNDTGNWVITRDDPLVSTQRFARRTFHVHLKDYVWNDGIWNMVPLGDGIINLPALLRELQVAPPPSSW